MSIIIRIAVRSYYDVMADSAKCTKIYTSRRNVNYFILQPIVQQILLRYNIHVYGFCIIIFCFTVFVTTVVG